jgi:hypothetical protein
MKTGDLIKFALLGAGGYMLYQYLVSSGMWAQWFGGTALAAGAAPTPILPVGTMLPAGTSQPAGGNTGQVQVLLHDNSGSSIFKAGDTWNLSIIGPPNAPVTIVAAQNGTPVGGGVVTQLGMTDASGRFSLNGSWSAANAGAWSEQIMVGGVPAAPLNFSVGLSGVGDIVPVPNYGPVVAPVAPAPASMSFGNRGFSGGYSAGQRGKVNRYIQ